MRVRSPPLDRRQTYPTPDLIADSSAPTSDDDTMDVEMPDQPEGDHEQEMDMNGGGFEYENGAVDQTRVRHDESRDQGYAFGAAGSGGFGFGPGAMEDEEDEEITLAGKCKYILAPAKEGDGVLISSYVPVPDLPFPHPPSEPTPLFQSLSTFLPPPQIPSFGTNILYLPPSPFITPPRQFSGFVTTDYVCPASA